MLERIELTLLCSFVQILNRPVDPRPLDQQAQVAAAVAAAQPALAIPPAVPQLPLLPQQVITAGIRKDCIRLRGLPYEAQVEHILEFLGDHAKRIAYRGVHMIYNAQVSLAFIFVLAWCFLCWKNTRVGCTRSEVVKVNNRSAWVIGLTRTGTEEIVNPKRKLHLSRLCLTPVARMTALSIFYYNLCRIRLSVYSPLVTMISRLCSVNYSPMTYYWTVPLILEWTTHISLGN